MRAIDELRREEHVDLNLLLELKKMARSTFYYHMNNIGNALLFDDDERVYVFYGTGEQVELTSDLQGVVEGSHRQMFKREADETGILEGSRLVKHQGRYYLLMISHVYELGRHRREVCYRADNLAGPWEKKINLY